MTSSDKVLRAAREYGEHYFHPAPLSSVEIAGPVLGLGGGRESWLVRVACLGRCVVVSVVVTGEGVAEVTHRTRQAA